MSADKEVVHPLTKQVYRLTPEGLDPIEGEVDYRSPDILGIRADDALYRFICGFDGSVGVGHHLYADDVDAKEAEGAWQAWLTRLSQEGEEEASP